MPNTYFIFNNSLEKLSKHLKTGIITCQINENLLVAGIKMVIKVQVLKKQNYYCGIIKLETRRDALRRRNPPSRKTIFIKQVYKNLINSSKMNFLKISFFGHM